MSTKLTKNLESWSQVKKTHFSSNDRQELELRVRLKLALRKLREEREAQGLSQQDIADKTGLPRTTISKIESGFQNVSIMKIMQVASALGKDVEIGLVR